MSEENEVVEKLFPTLVAELDTRFTTEQIASVNIGIKYCREELLKALQDGTLSLESRLKEVVKNNAQPVNIRLAKQCEKLAQEAWHFKQASESLEQRLSQAEAELEKTQRGEKSADQEVERLHTLLEKSMSMGDSSLMEENAELKTRLSHLMDVAGKMAGALKKCECLYYIHDCEDHARDRKDGKWCERCLALAEWDGIKDGGK